MRRIFLHREVGVDSNHAGRSFYFKLPEVSRTAQPAEHDATRAAGPDYYLRRCFQIQVPRASLRRHASNAVACCPCGAR